MGISVQDDMQAPVTDRDVGGRVYDVLRRRAKLDWWIERTGLSLETNSRLRAISFLILEERKSLDDVKAMFTGTRHCPELLSDPEAELAEALYGRPAAQPRYAGPCSP